MKPHNKHDVVSFGTRLSIKSDSSVGYRIIPIEMRMYASNGLSKSADLAKFITEVGLFYHLVNIVGCYVNLAVRGF
jgi:hypothetical protein